MNTISQSKQTIFNAQEGVVMSLKSDEQQLKRATKKATELARMRDKEFFVVLDPSYHGDFHPYAVAGACHLDGFFAGAKVVFATKDEV